MTEVYPVPSSKTSGRSGPGIRGGAHGAGMTRYLRRVDTGGESVWIPLISFTLLSGFPEVMHAVSTRRGGVSRGPFSSFNLGDHVGDDPEDVRNNLLRFRGAAGFSELFLVHQVHGDRVAVAERDGPCPDADAVITREPGLGLLIRQADCASVLLFDPETKAVANIHSGWRGLVRNIVGSTVYAMKQVFGCRPEHLLAVQTPSLGPCCAEYKDHRHRFPSRWQRYMREAAHFDFWELIEHQLMESGIREQRMASARICTRCRRELFYSYRAQPITGRFGAVIGLSHGL